MIIAAASAQSAAPGLGLMARLFPRRIDNTFRGHPLANWLLAALVLMRLVIGVNSIVITRAVASGPDAIPLASFSPAASDTVISLFSLLGLSFVLTATQAAIVLVRYRAMIPQVYLLMLAQTLGTKALLVPHPIARSDASPLGATIGAILPVMMLIGLGASLMGPALHTTREGDL